MSRPEDRDEPYDEAPYGYVTTGLDGSIQRINRTLLDWTGSAPDLLLSTRRFQDLLTKPGRIYYETHFAPMLRLHGAVKEVSLDLIRADGTRLPVLANAVLVRDADGRPASIRTTVVDLTERLRYEHELLLARRRAEELAAVVKASGDAIVLLAPDATIRAWNGGAERLFGWRADEAVGRSERDLVVPADRLEEYDRSLSELQGGREVRLETVRLTRDGRRLDVSITATPVEEALGEVVAVASIVRDITEQRRAEEERRRSERLQVVSTLAGGVAHEVNNQMTAVLGLGEFVLRDLGPGHPQAADVRDMMTAAARAARVSQQLLAFSQQQLYQPRVLDLYRVVSELAGRLSRLLGEDKRLLLEPGGTLGRVLADPRTVEQMLVNLVANARDAMDPGGRLTVAVADATLGEEERRGHAQDEVVPGAYVMLSVEDTGRGMDPATLARIFEPFFTTRPVGEGTGLGLSMVYGIVKQHGGQIWVASAPEQGTLVRIYLPVVSADWN